MMELAFPGRHYPIIDHYVNLLRNPAAAPFQVRKDCARGISSEENELPRSLLRRIYFHYEVRHSRMLLAGIQAKLGLDPR